MLVVCILLFVILPIVGATLMSLVWALLVGLVFGAIARLLVPGTTRMGCLTTSLIGLAGSLLGTLVAKSLHTGSFGRWLLQVGAAALLVLVLRPRQSTAP